MDGESGRLLQYVRCFVNASNVCKGTCTGFGFILRSATHAVRYCEGQNTQRVVSHVAEGQVLHRKGAWGSSNSALTEESPSLAFLLLGGAAGALLA